MQNLPEYDMMTPDEIVKNMRMRCTVLFSASGRSRKEEGKAPRIDSFCRREFMFQYSVILGNVGQCSDRYMTCGYGRPFELPELFERVASIPGVTGIEYIGNWHLSDKTVHQIAELQKQYGFRAVAIIPDHFGTPIWSKGAFTAPDAKVRKAAVEETVRMAELAREIGCPMLSLWNGQDGYDYPLQADYTDAARWLADGLGECCARIPDQKISAESLFPAKRMGSAYAHRRIRREEHGRNDRRRPFSGGIRKRFGGRLCRDVARQAVPFPYERQLEALGRRYDRRLRSYDRVY